MMSMDAGAAAADSATGKLASGGSQMKLPDGQMNKLQILMGSAPGRELKPYETKIENNSFQDEFEKEFVESEVAACYAARALQLSKIPKIPWDEVVWPKTHVSQVKQSGSSAHAPHFRRHQTASRPRPRPRPRLRPQTHTQTGRRTPIPDVFWQPHPDRREGGTLAGRQARSGTERGRDGAGRQPYHPTHLSSHQPTHLPTRPAMGDATLSGGRIGIHGLSCLFLFPRSLPT